MSSLRSNMRPTLEALAHRRAASILVCVVAFTTVIAFPQPSAGASTPPVAQVVVGQYHACARLVDGTARCWGRNRFGRLGDGTTTDRLTPVTVTNPTGTGPLTDIAQLTTSWDHSCALLGDATAVCWGWNGNGRLGDGTTTSRTRPVVVRDATGVAPLAGIVQIAGGINQTCARLTDASAVCWGSNKFGQLGDQSTVDRPLPVTVLNAAGDGPLTNIAQIGTGRGHSCARSTDGTMRCWGLNYSGQLGDNTRTNRLSPVVVKNAFATAPLTGVVQITTTWDHTCARRSDATARCWGNNGAGRLGDGTTTLRRLPVVVKNTAGTGALTAIMQLATGRDHTCAVGIDLRLRCWGNNQAGQLADGTTTNRLLPVVALDSTGTTALTNVAQVAPAITATCAARTDGSAWCWGNNAYGQLGNGTTTSSPLPIGVQFS